MFVKYSTRESAETGSPLRPERAKFRPTYARRRDLNRGLARPHQGHGMV